MLQAPEQEGIRRDLRRAHLLEQRGGGGPSALRVQQAVLVPFTCADTNKLYQKFDRILILKENHAPAREGKSVEVEEE